MYSNTTGTRLCSAPSGIHSRALRRMPSGMGIQAFSSTLKGRVGGSSHLGVFVGVEAANNELAASAGAAASVPRRTWRRVVVMDEPHAEAAMFGVLANFCREAILASGEVQAPCRN